MIRAVCPGNHKKCLPHIVHAYGPVVKPKIQKKRKKCYFMAQVQAGKGRSYAKVVRVKEARLLHDRFGAGEKGFAIKWKNVRAAVCADMRRAGTGAVDVWGGRGAQAASTQPAGAAEHQPVEQRVKALTERKRFFDGAGEHCVFKLRAKLVDLRAKIEQLAGRRDGMHGCSSFMKAVESVVCGWG